MLQPVSLPDPATGEPGELTQALLTSIGNMVRQRPEQWCWTYKRWKFIPPERDWDGYPPYARWPTVFDSSAWRKSGKKR